MTHMISIEVNPGLAISQTISMRHTTLVFLLYLIFDQAVFVGPLHKHLFPFLLFCLFQSRL